VSSRRIHPALKPETELLKIMKKRDLPRMTSSIWATALKREDRLACKLIAKAVEAIGASLLSLSAPAPAGEQFRRAPPLSSSASCERPVRADRRGG
jgi:hypothetical protein